LRNSSSLFLLQPTIQKFNSIGGPLLALKPGSFASVNWLIDIQVTLKVIHSEAIKVNLAWPAFLKARGYQVALRTMQLTEFSSYGKLKDTPPERGELHDSW
jgi:hypothetical protein